MRRIRVVITTLAVGLLGGVVRAGVYNLEDAPPRYPPLGVAHKDIRLVLDPWRVAAIPVVPEQAREGYQKLAAELEAKADDQRTALDRLKLGVCYLRLGRPVEAARVLRSIAEKDVDLRTRLTLQEAELEAKAPGDLTTADSVNLGACYLRLGRPNDAEKVLSNADRRHFLVLANLAAAYQALNLLDRAVGFQGAALDAWPEVQPGWSAGELIWFRRVEGYNLKLLKIRYQESQPNSGNKPWDKMDPLFDKPRATAVEYGPQIPPWKLWGDLPPDAYAVVGQLLLWQPNDDRLYWQLGELLNAMGNVQEAYDVFDELISARNASTVRELKEHRKALAESLDFANAFREKYATDPAGAARFQTDFHALMWAVSPRGLVLAPPVVGDLAGETAQAASAQAYGMQQQPQPGNPPPAETRRGWLPDWQPIFVGFAAGLIVAILGALQWTEWRRRRHAVAPRSAVPTPPSPRTEPAVHDAGAFRTDAPHAPDRVEGAP